MFVFKFTAEEVEYRFDQFVENFLKGEKEVIKKRLSSNSWTVSVQDKKFYATVELQKKLEFNFTPFLEGKPDRDSYSIVELGRKDGDYYSIVELKEKDKYDYAVVGRTEDDKSYVVDLVKRDKYDLFEYWYVIAEGDGVVNNIPLFDKEFDEWFINKKS